jgi:hypothetical protein
MRGVGTFFRFAWLGLGSAGPRAAKEELGPQLCSWPYEACARLLHARIDARVPTAGAALYAGRLRFKVGALAGDARAPLFHVAQNNVDHCRHQRIAQRIVLSEIGQAEILQD